MAFSIFYSILVKSQIDHNFKMAKAKRLLLKKSATKTIKKIANIKVVKSKPPSILSPSPVVIERSELDDLLIHRMQWKSNSIATIKAIVKLKVLAQRVQELHLVHTSSFDCPSPRDIRKLKANKKKQMALLLKQRLDFLNLKTVVMAGDGNCQFRSFSYELFGTQNYHAFVRAQAVAHMKSNKHTYSSFVFIFIL